MFNLYGSTGLGAAGTGETSFGIMPGRRVPPDVAAVLQQLLNHGSVSPQPVSPTTVPSMQGGAGAAPMAALIGAGSPGAAPTPMGGGQMMPQQPMPQGVGQALVQPALQQQAGAPNNNLLLMQMLQQLQHSASRKGLHR